MRRALVLLALAAPSPAGDEERLDRLVRALRDGSASTAAAARLALRGTGREAWPRLFALLEHPDPEVRRRARGIWEAMAREEGDWWGLPAPGSGFRDGLPTRVLHKATGIEMVLVPAGTFVPGADPDGPPVEIVRPFYLATCEVTQAQYRKGWPGAFLFFSPERGSYPVTGISFDGLQPWLERTGLRLPTEAEWEYACRSGGRTPAEGPEEPARACVPAARESLPAGEGSPNALGLFGMSGNVAEWCADDAGEGRRVARGGSFADSPGRGPHPRHVVDSGRRARWIGFRVVRDP